MAKAPGAAVVLTWRLVLGLLAWNTTTADLCVNRCYGKDRQMA
jgi:hypothetical protein